MTPTHTGLPATTTTARTSALGWLTLIPVAVFVLAASRLGMGGDWAINLTWIPSLGIDFSLLLDGLALQFVLLISGIGAMVFIYAAGYMAGVAQRTRLYVLLLLFMVAMLGCVTADNLLLLFLFWEMTSLTAFLLVGFKHESESARKAAQQALMVTAGGGLVLLAGFILLGHIAGTYVISDLIASAPEWRDNPLVPVALICVCIGAFTKSAQVPFHFWLPGAMAAPTPVSAYLHSVTMVKLGVYLLARLDPAFDDLLLWRNLLVSVGAITATWAMLLTLRERDLKRILAWSTVSALGTLVMFIGLPGKSASIAVATFLLAHALYKAPLFFVAGNVDHCTGTRNIDHFSGLAPRMPWTAAAAALAALSMAGMPFSLGFVAKGMFGAAKAEGDIFIWASYSSVFINVISVAAASVAAIRVFWHRGGGQISKEIHEAGWAMRLPPLVVAGLGITFGFAPSLLNSLIGDSARAMQANTRFTGLTDELTGSHTLGTVGVTMVLGAVVFILWDRIHFALERIMQPWGALGAVAWYGRLLTGIPALAGVLTRRLQNGRLTVYATFCFGFMTLFLGLALWRSGPLPMPIMQTPSLAVAGASLILIAATVAVCMVRDPFVLLLTSGFVGLSSALLFLFLAAPDLAITQFTVEVAFVVVVAAILLRMRQHNLEPLRESPVLPRALLSIAVSAVLVTLLLTASADPLDTSLSDFFTTRSLPEAYGRNVVNVILVDFRAVDTLGEISVVAIALLGTIPLLALLRRDRKKTV